MDTNKMKTLYESPEATIYETRVQSVICGSPAGGVLDGKMGWEEMEEW